MSTIFEFSIAELGYTPVFKKIWEQYFWLVFDSVLSNWDKNEDKDEEIQEK